MTWTPTAEDERIKRQVRAATWEVAACEAERLADLMADPDDARRVRALADHFAACAQRDRARPRGAEDVDLMDDDLMVAPKRAELESEIARLHGLDPLQFVQCGVWGQHTEYYVCTPEGREVAEAAKAAAIAELAAELARLR